MFLVEKVILVALALDAAVAIALPLAYYASLRTDHSRREDAAPPGGGGTSP